MAFDPNSLVGTSNEKYLKYKDSELQNLINDQAGATEFERSTAKNLLQYRLDYVNPPNVNPQLANKTNDELLRMYTSPGGIEGFTENEKSQAKKLLEDRKNINREKRQRTQKNKVNSESKNMAEETTNTTEEDTSTETNQNTSTDTQENTTPPETGDSVKLKGKTGEELKEDILKKKTERADMTGLPEEKKLDLKEQKVQDDETLDYLDYELDEDSGEIDKYDDEDQIDTEDYDQDSPDSPETDPSYTANQVGDFSVGENPVTLNAANKTMSDGAKVAQKTGTISGTSTATITDATLDNEAKVSYQIEQLFKSIEEGTELPAWASPAVRKASAIMAQRGLGSSSMAAAAITQAIYEAGIPIATADANAASKLQLQNLSGKQQATLQNAMNSANMDIANLNAAQTAAVNTAKNFLAIDLANLTNDQQAAIIDFQTTVQGLFTDAAADNAAKQFNAKTEAELDQFFAELEAQVETTELNRKASLEMYNVSQEISVDQFNAQMEASREQFNSNMRRQIEAATAVWRRTLNTANTAAENEEIRQNLQTLLELSETAQNDLWQMYRDMAAWTMQTAENNIDRTHNAAMQSAAIDANADIYDDKFEDFLIVETIDNIFS
jgi:hypothetical protein